MPSPALAVLTVLKRGGPALIKQLPKLWPLLLEQRNRDALVDAAKRAASRSPDQRLRGRVEGTVAVARDTGERAVSDEQRERAVSWGRRGHDMLAQLDIPTAHRAARAARRASVSRQLDELQQEMEETLSRGA